MESPYFLSLDRNRDQSEQFPIREATLDQVHNLDYINWKEALYQGLVALPEAPAGLTGIAAPPDT